MCPARRLIFDQDPLVQLVVRFMMMVLVATQDDGALPQVLLVAAEHGAGAHGIVEDLGL
jgi:hypothetical protein